MTTGAAEAVGGGGSSEAAAATAGYQPGGFIPPLSPPPSSTTSSALHNNSALPQPRRSPLKSGGTKESSFIRFVDQKILHIQRRFAKRDRALEQNVGRVKEVDEDGRLIQEMSETTTPATALSEEWYDVPGYASFGEAATEVEELINVTWVSGTPSLQVPYLISLALLTSSMIPAFPASPKPLFRLLGKLDHAFASLIQQRDIDTGDPLPGFSMRRGVSGTEKVRIKSLVERTRVCVVDVMSKGEFEEDDYLSAADESAQSDLDGDLVLEGPDELDLEEELESEDWEMYVARVYDKTLVELGDSMGGPEIGIRTEPVR
ncbi:hypothetical protein AAFC00_000732 [Neodothiora populina]|uniref:Uncharacterized protein n=1 Tax=Neodothiora populina TaxID=2781224 RepID=A0ABR3PDW5_9PEZI